MREEATGMRTGLLSDAAADRAANEGYLAQLGTDDSAFRRQLREAFFRGLQEELIGRQ